MTEPARARERPRRRGRERSRYEVGGGWSPSIISSPYDREEHEFWREREIQMIERALEDHGEMRWRDLGSATGCKYWGPGRFRSALRDALGQGRIRRVGFGRYALAEGRGRG